MKKNKSAGLCARSGAALLLALLLCLSAMLVGCGESPALTADTNPDDIVGDKMSREEWEQLFVDEELNFSNYTIRTTSQWASEDGVSTTNYLMHVSETNASGSMSYSISHSDNGVPYYYTFRYLL